WRESDRLPKQRPQRRSCLDDRTLGTERAAGPDSKRSRNGFQQRYSKPHATVAEENGLHRLWNPMALQGWLPEVDHDADQQATDRGNQHNPKTQMVVGRIAVRERKLSVKEDVREELDQQEQALSDQPCYQAHQYRKSADPYDLRFKGNAKLPLLAGLCLWYRCHLRNRKFSHADPPSRLTSILILEFSLKLFRTVSLFSGSVE